MKKLLLICTVFLFTTIGISQEALKIQSGGSITIQPGAELVLQGGLTLDNGSNLLNNGTISLKNNTISNISNWTDNSILGALTGNGIVIFNSTHAQQFTGLTTFYAVYINTNDLTINNDLNISNLLRLIKGRINTSNFVVALVNTAASSLENDITNTGYSNSWVNGNFRRSIAANINIYDFPVGNSVRSNLLKFINNNITGPIFLTSSFGPKPGTDAGLNVTENGNTYTAVNNGGVWKLIPNTAATGGNYAMHLYFNGFTGLQDNRFGILRRPDASTNAADWITPTGSLLESLNGTGRKISDAFARRYNISDFSQLGIGEFNLATPCEITGQSQVCIGSLNNIYSAPAGMTTYFWSVTGAGFTGSNTSQTFNITVPNSPGTFTINLMTTLNGVQAQCSKTVTITPTPICEITGANDLCVQSTNNTYSGPGNMTTYLWTASAGLQIVGSNTNSSINVNTVAPGLQLITLNATGMGGCVSQCTKMVNVNPMAPCTITGASNITTGTTNNQYTAPANMSSYSWSISGNGTIIGSTTGSSVNITAGATGSFTLVLTTTLNGCSRTCDKTVTVDPSTSPNCTITGAADACTGSFGNIYSGTEGMSSYSWIISGNGTIIGSTTGSSVNITAGAAGSFTLTLDVTSNGSTSRCTKTVTVTAASPCIITGSETATTGSTANNYSGPAGMSSYSWIISGNGTIIGSTSGSSVNITAGATGGFTLSLTTTINGCSRTCDKIVTVNPTTTYSCSITGQSEVCNESLTTFTVPAGLSSYSWIISGNGTIIGSITGSSVTVASFTGSYTLTVQTMLNGVPCSSQKRVTVIECVNACTYTQGFYGNKTGTACFNNSGATMSSSQLMLNAFGATTSMVFGNVANKRFFTLFKSDITNGNIYKMLPGGGNARAIDIDNKSPFDGSYYADESTWPLVPLESKKQQKGKIRNSLLAQSMVLWFNLRNSSTLGSISLVDDTLVTKATESCGSTTPIGEATKFGLPHNVIVYLNGGNGYAATINGLFSLANDVLGGVVTNISASSINEAVDVINNAFDECRILVGRIPYNVQLLTKTQIIIKVNNPSIKENAAINSLKVIAYPNPYKNHFQLQVTSPITEMAYIEFFTMIGQKIHEINKPVIGNATTIIPYNGSLRFATLAYKVTIGKYIATGIVLRPN